MTVIRDYKAPEMDVLKLDVKDIITASNEESTTPGENGELTQVGNFFDWFSAE